MPFARWIVRGDAFSHARSRTLSSTSDAATVMLANAGNQEQDRCARNDLFERGATTVALEQVGSRDRVVALAGLPDPRSDEIADRIGPRDEPRNHTP
uniref:Uncharacterized protein n=1 Tax=Burkholderia cenocepacia TaxID=95486 RepID=A0A071M3E9_9BURK